MLIDENGSNYTTTLKLLLASNLNFHNIRDYCPTHHLHSFSAKYPPLLPRVFIMGLTQPGDIVLDPMTGSGTTVLEALIAGRHGIGMDIDPLSLKITKAKLLSYSHQLLETVGAKICDNATHTLITGRNFLQQELANIDPNTKSFMDYWFDPDSQLEIHALIQEINRITNSDIRTYSEIVLSSIIITKTGGVSLALDLGHTRPRMAKIVRTGSGELQSGHPYIRHANILTKTIRSPLKEFQARWNKNIKTLKGAKTKHGSHLVAAGNSQSIALKDSSVDLIVTSPPYASNAIDYMRAHKFALVWLGYPIDTLGKKRSHYIGGESITDIDLSNLPDHAQQIVEKVISKENNKGLALHRYYSEMKRVLQEMHRVLKPGKAAIVVVGNSILKGVDTETATCLAEIGQQLGFHVPHIGVRHLDRNKRMLPASTEVDAQSQIQQRMHEEYVIGFYKST